MKEPILLIKKNFEDAQIPVRQHETDSGLDLFFYRIVKLYAITGDVFKMGDTGYFDHFLDNILTLYPGERVLIDTGISATVGKGYEIQIRPRSGLALKQGLTVLNTPGTIDESYTGMIGVILINNSLLKQQIDLGSRIAQMVVCPVTLCGVKVVNDLNETKRGGGGFGHTGI